MWGDAYLSRLSPEDFLKAVGLKTLLKTLSVREIEDHLRKLGGKKRDIFRISDALQAGCRKKGSFQNYRTILL